MQIIVEEKKEEEEEKEEVEENKIDKYLIDKIYKMKTIITNISSNDTDCEVLINIPEGTIPIKPEDYKSIYNINIKSYKSKIFENLFYFPKEGIFKQYPASISINDLVVAKSKIKVYEVVSENNIPKIK